MISAWQVGVSPGVHPASDLGVILTGRAAAEYKSRGTSHETNIKGVVIVLASMSNVSVKV